MPRSPRLGALRYSDQKPDKDAAYVKFTNQEIADLKQLIQKSSQLIPPTEPFPSQGESRADLLALFKQTLQEGWEKLRQFHLKGASGHRIVRGHTHLSDTLLQVLYQLISAPHSPGEKTLREAFSLVATGGYGRKELAPYSDIDLLFLMPDTPSPEMNACVSKMLYFLWDLGLEVGQAVRSINDCVVLAEKELEIRTSLLESRFIAGNKKLFQVYRATLFEQVLLKNPGAFLRGKLLEQRKRHERFGNSMFYLEPNLKENPGGLRDIHTFFWISKYRYQVDRIRELVPRGIITSEEYQTFTRSRAFLQRVRNALHYRAKRRDDRLTFHHQLEIAEEFGYRNRPGVLGVEQFMRRYYQVARQVGNLSHIFLQKYQEEHQKVTGEANHHLEGPFWIVGDKITVQGENVFKQNPVHLLAIFEVAQRRTKGIHPDTFRLITQNLGLIDQKFRQNPDVNALFMKMLNGIKAVAWVLRRMNTCGLLGRFMPEFGRVVGQTQHDLYHVYTVDEHTILAVEALRHIKGGRFTRELPLSTRLISQIKNPVVLYLSVLFHDIAKGRQGDHSILGAEMATRVCRRMGLPDQEVQLVSWLVKNHLIFSRTAFRRDISDPQTVAQFSQQIPDKCHLDLLLLLTVADIRAVGPNTWNQWKATLLRKLYNLTLETMTEGGLSKPQELSRRAEGTKRAVARLLADQWPEALINEHLDRFYPEYFASYTAEVLARHFSDLAPLQSEPLGIVFHASPDSGTTNLLIHTQDHPGLIVKISGALAARSANILSANIHTSKDGMALDIFVLEDWQGGAIESEQKLERIHEALTQVLKGQVLPEELLSQVDPRTHLQDPFEVATSVKVDDSFDLHTILEVTAKDRLGLLFAITHLLQRHQVQVRAAKIATYGERAVDVFYLRDLYGLKLNEKKTKRLNRDLNSLLEQMDKGEPPWTWVSKVDSGTPPDSIPSQARKV
ncbi:MAG: [protein-PII] uridylyltransferase [Magnetococcales bacterium]|nr:[protein-PII] uridylyltransferase [Magnetococcales bacterium]